jgi:hypothetical protein
MNAIRRAALVAVPAALVGGIAHANTTTNPGDAVFTAVQSQVTTYGTAGFALLVIVLGFTIGMKLVKKMVSKAT